MKPFKLDVKKMGKSKIDKGRALAIMGFTSARPLDACMGNFEKIRDILDAALFTKTQEILHGMSAGPKGFQKGKAPPKRPAKGLKGKKEK